MRFGIFGSAEADGPQESCARGQGFRDYIEHCVEAEALGFVSTFLVEHHFSGWNQVSATLMLQTCVAMNTATIRLGTAVLVLTWHNPVLLAEQAATLDLLSDGRLDLGVGKGYRHNEFTGFSLRPEEAEARFEESLEVLTRAWTSRQRFSHRGRFWQFDDIVVEPAPLQAPHPPLWVAAGSEASVRRAAQRGFNLILDQYASAEQIGARLALYRSELERLGRAFDPHQVAVARQVYVATSRSEAEHARRLAASYTQRTVSVSRRPGGVSGGSHVLAYADGPGGAEAHALYGSPDDICRELQALRSVGVAYVIVTSVPGGREQLRRFAKDVVPAFA